MMTLCRALTGVLMLLLAACQGGGGETAPATTSALAQLGERIYHDRNLSGSGRMSCATCHDPLFTHGPPNALAVQVGGTFETEFGVRAAPSLRYLERQPPFDATLRRGGLMADGRADTLAQQALLPWFSPLELDVGDAATLVRKLRAAPYVAQFDALFPGAADDATTVRRMAQALQAFQQEDPRFHPYDSKFDLVAAGRESFSAAEQRGRTVFEDPARGNCAGCHPSRPGSDGRPPQFTDFGYAALGVPRNAAIPRNANAAYFDLGLCGPQRQDQPAAANCGLFRTPGLRNVARRPVFFHNGLLKTLPDALRFYATRDTRPLDWYAGEPFDDLPRAYHANLMAVQPISAAEQADLACFLATLSDGHVPGTPPSAACVQ